MSTQEQNSFKGETEDAGNENNEYVLRLFVTGASSKSVRAIINLKQICKPI